MYSYIINIYVIVYVKYLKMMKYLKINSMYVLLW
jgi:hypothetical protein